MPDAGRAGAARQEAAEERASQDQGLLRMAVRVSRVGAWQVDLASNFLTWSEGTAEIHDEPPGFCPSIKVAIDYYIPEHREVISEAFQSCVKEGVAFDLELQIVTAKGRHISVRSMGEAVVYSGGVIVRVQGALQDISDRKSAEAEASRTAARLESTLESITDAFYTLDAEGRFTYLNREAERILQRSRESLLGQSSWEGIADSIGAEFKCECRRAIGEGVRIQMESFYEPLGIWLSIRAYPSSEGLAVYLQDITAQHETQQALRMLGAAVEQAKESIVITDAQILLPGPRILFVNPAFTAMTGYEPSEVLGKTPRILQGPATNRVVIQRLRRAMEQGEEFEGEVVNYRKDGTEFHLEWRVAPLRDQEGKITHFVALQRDVTERKQAEAALENAHRLLRDASRQAGMAEVATGVLHNVGNVLNSVNVSATLIAEPREIRALQPARVAACCGSTRAISPGFSPPSKGQQLPAFLATLAEHLAQEQQKRRFRDRIRSTRNIEHIKEIVAMQQSYARVAGITEVLSGRVLVEDALRINDAALERHRVERRARLRDAARRYGRQAQGSADPREPHAQRQRRHGRSRATREDA